MKSKKIQKIVLSSILMLSVFAQTSVKANTDTKKITSVVQNDKIITITFADKTKMQINFLTDEIFHLQKVLEKDSFMDKISTPKGKENAHIVVKNDSEYAGSDYQFENDENTITIKNAKLNLVINKNTGTMTLSKKNGEVIFREIEAISLDNNASSQKLAIDNNEYFFGGGTQNGRFSHKDTRIEIKNTNNWVDGGVASPNPFYWSTKGYGMLRNTYNPGFYDFGKSENNTVINQHNDPRFDSYFFIGETPKQLLQEYVTLTGKPAQLPDYAYYLGHLNCYNRDYWVETNDTSEKQIDGKYYTEHNPNGGSVPAGAIKESLLSNGTNKPFTAQHQIELHKEHDMPLGWFLPNDGYGCGFGQNQTDIDANIENLRQFSEFAKQNGVTTGLWTQSDLVPKGDNAILQRDFNKEVTKANVRSLKTDVAWVGSGYTFGLNGLEEATRILNTTGEKTNVVTLDGWAGTQRYGGIWTGDQTGGQWEYIRFHIPTFIGTGLSGQPHIGSDMDGIFGGNNPTIQVRDFQYKTFAGYMLDMDGWGSSQKNPWEFGGKYEDINRAYLKLKAQLLPYTATESELAHQSGYPILRAMMLEYPSNYTYGTATQYQYLWGNNFLVAPVYQNTQMTEAGDDIRNDIYLPNATDGSEIIWIDYITGKQYRGGNVLNNFNAPLWKLPVFVKNGAIIPMFAENNNPQPITATNPKGLDRSQRIVEFYPHETSSYTVYEDNGVTKNGANLQTEITSAVEDNVATITLHKAVQTGDASDLAVNKNTTLIVNTAKKPTNLTLTIADQNQTLTEVNSEEAFNNATGNVYFYNEHPKSFIQKYAKTADIKNLNITTSPKLYVKTTEKINVVENSMKLRIEGFDNNTITAKNKLNTNLSVPQALRNDDANTTPSQITLAWDAVENAVSYDVLTDNQLQTNITNPTFAHQNLKFSTPHTYKVRAVNEEGYSNWSEPITISTKDDPYRNVPDNYRVYANVGEQSGQELSKLYDHDLATLWHTDWSKPNSFTTLDIDLNGSYSLDRIEYFPRNDAGNGTILSGNIEISKDGVHYKQIGSFNWEANGETKTYKFPENIERFSYARMSNIRAIGGFGSGQELIPYAKDPKRKFVSLDYNDDKEINEGELTFLQNYAGLSKAHNDSDWNYVEVADVNYNNVIDATDISAITRMLDGGLTYTPNEQSQGKFKLVADKETAAAHEKITYKVYGIGLANVNAISFALPIDTTKFENVKITPTLQTMHMSNFSTVRTHSNNETTAYVLLANKGTQNLIEGDGAVATITMDAKTNVSTAIEPTFALTTNRSLLDSNALLTNEALQAETITATKLTTADIASVLVKNSFTNGWISPESLMQDGNYSNLYDGDTSTESEFKWYLNPNSFTQEVSLPTDFKFTLNEVKPLSKFIVYNRNNLNGNGTITSLKASYIDENDAIHELSTITTKESKYTFTLPENTNVKAIIVTPLTSIGTAPGIASGSEQNRMLTFSEVELYANPTQATNIEASYLNTDMFVNQLQKINVNITPDNAIAKQYNVTSSDENIIKVERYTENNQYQYLLQSRNPGSATITLSLISNPEIKQEIVMTVHDGTDNTYLNTLLSYANNHLSESVLYTKEYIEQLTQTIAEISASELNTQDKVDEAALRLYNVLITAKYSGSDETRKNSLSQITGEFSASATSFAEVENAIPNNVLDNDPNTIWHSDYSGDYPLPQSITIDLQKNYNLAQISHLARQESSNGHITQYRIETSTDNNIFVPIVAGNFENNGESLLNPSEENIIKFKPVLARYIRFTAEKAIGSLGRDNDRYASIAELKFFEYEAPINQTVNGVTVQIDENGAPANTTVSARNLGIKEIDGKTLTSFEINLMKENEHVNLYENTTARVTLPADEKKVVDKIYYIKDNKIVSEQEIINYTPHDRFVTFTTNHFSEYAISYLTDNEKQDNVSSDNTTKAPNTIENNNNDSSNETLVNVDTTKPDGGIKKDAPATNDDSANTIFIVISLMAIGGFIFLSRKNKK